MVDEGERAPRPVLRGRGRRGVLQGRSLGQVRGWLWADIWGAGERGSSQAQTAGCSGPGWRWGLGVLRREHWAMSLTMDGARQQPLEGPSWTQGSRRRAAKVQGTWPTPWVMLEVREGTQPQEALGDMARLDCGGRRGWRARSCAVQGVCGIVPAALSPACPCECARAPGPWSLPCPPGRDQGSGRNG